MKKVILGIVLIITLMGLVKAQQVSFTGFDSTSFKGSAMTQAEHTVVLVSAIGNPRLADVMFCNKQVAAMLQGSSPFTSNGPDQMFFVSGTMDNDTIVICVTMRGDSAISFRLYRTSDLTLQSEHPFPGERPTHPGCSLDPHDMAVSPSGYTAMNYSYLDTTSHYGDSSGLRIVQFQLTAISDSSHYLVKEIRWDTVYTPSTWLPKYSAVPPEWAPLSGPIPTPFHINSLHFENDTIIDVSMRADGATRMNWPRGVVLNAVHSGTDSLAYQHDVIVTGGDTMTCYSNGDTSQRPKGLVIKLSTNTIISSFAPFGPDSTTCAYANGAYQHTDKFNLICTGNEYNIRAPFGDLANMFTAVRAIATNGDTLFDLYQKGMGTFWAHLFTSDGWGTVITPKKVNNIFTLVAKHPVTNRIATWYGRYSAGWRPITNGIVNGDTLKFNGLPNGLDSVMFEVASRDSSGWYLFSPPIELTQIPTCQDYFIGSSTVAHDTVNGDTAFVSSNIFVSGQRADTTGLMVITKTDTSLATKWNITQAIFGDSLVTSLFQCDTITTSYHNYFIRTVVYVWNDTISVQSSYDTTYLPAPCQDHFIGFVTLPTDSASDTTILAIHPVFGTRQVIDTTGGVVITKVDSFADRELLVKKVVLGDSVVVSLLNCDTTFTHHYSDTLTVIFATFSDTVLVSFSYDTTTDTTLGIKDLKEWPDVMVYPNPFSKEFKICTNGSAPYTAELLNEFGQIIWQMESRGSCIIAECDHNMPSGTYFLRVHIYGIIPIIKKIVVLP